MSCISIKSELSNEAIVELNRFWDTAMDIAIVSAALAKHIGFNKADEAYSLGLFHNVGIPLMYQKFPDYFKIVEESYSGGHSRIIDAENKAYSTNHAVVGYYAARSWRLSKVMCEAIADHHNVLKHLTVAGHSEKSTLMAILKIAEHICGIYKSLGGQTIDYEWQSIKKDIFAYTGLGQYDLDNLVESFADMGISDGDSFY